LKPQLKADIRIPGLDDLACHQTGRCVIGVACFKQTVTYRYIPLVLMPRCALLWHYGRRSLMYMTGT
jgi:hypothetical protein